MIRFFFDHVTVRIGGHRLLENTNWRIDANHSWAVIGPNGSGKTTLMHALAGHAAVVAGRIHRNDAAAQPQAIGITSFERQNRLIQNEIAKDGARVFAGKNDDHLTVESLLNKLDQTNSSPFQDAMPLAAELNIDHLMQTPLRQLSMGELQRAFLVETVAHPPKVLILDEPFENLDKDHRQKLSPLLERLIQKGTQLFLVTHRLELIPPSISHVMALKNGLIFDMGSKEKMLAPGTVARIYDTPSKKSPVTPQEPPTGIFSRTDHRAEECDHPIWRQNHHRPSHLAGAARRTVGCGGTQRLR